MSFVCPWVPPGSQAVLLHVPSDACPQGIHEEEATRNPTCSFILTPPFAVGSESGAGDACGCQLRHDAAFLGSWTLEQGSEPGPKELRGLSTHSGDASCPVWYPHHPLPKDTRTVVSAAETDSSSAEQDGVDIQPCLFPSSSLLDGHSVLSPSLLLMGTGFLHRRQVSPSPLMPGCGGAGMPGMDCRQCLDWANRDLLGRKACQDKARPNHGE